MNYVFYMLMLLAPRSKQRHNKSLFWRYIYWQEAEDKKKHQCSYEEYCKIERNWLKRKRSK